MFKKLLVPGVGGNEVFGAGVTLKHVKSFATAILLSTIENRMLTQWRGPKPNGR